MATIVIATIYIVVSMLSNISSLRIINIFNLSMDAGTIYYPFTFTLRDLLHKEAGKKVAIQTILLGALMNIVMFLFFYIVSILPPDMAVGEQKEFGMVLNPSIRIIVGSIVAMVIAEIIDSNIYQLWVNHTKKYQWARVLLSNLISVPIDTIIMVFIAFYGMMDSSVLFSIIFTNVLLKYIVTIISLPLIYIIKKKE